MIELFEIIIAFSAIILFFAHLIFYKKSGSKEPIIEYKWYMGFLFSPKIFFPLSIKFNDSFELKKNKKKSNSLLAYFYILIVIDFILMLIFDKN